MASLDWGTIVTIVLAIVAFGYYVTKLEGRINGLKQASDDFDRDIEKHSARFEKLEARHDMAASETRALMLEIQKSISRIEGRLSISSNNNNNRD